MITECKQPCCWEPDEEDEDECQHHFIKLNDNQIFCEECGEIRGNGTSTECRHYCYHGCNCNHYTYPQYTWTNTWTIGPTTWTTPNIYSTNTNNLSIKV